MMKNSIKQWCVRAFPVSKSSVSRVASSHLSMGNDDCKSLQSLQDQLQSLKSQVEAVKTMINNHQTGKKQDPSNQSNTEMLVAIRTGTKSLDALKNIVDEMKKAQMLAVAIQNAEFNSFSFYNKMRKTADGRKFFNGEEMSTRLVRNILFAAQENRAIQLPEGYIEGDDDTDRMNFSQSIAKQIHDLTGFKPKLRRDRINHDAYKIFIFDDMRFGPYSHEDWDADYLGEPL